MMGYLYAAVLDPGGWASLYKFWQAQFVELGGLTQWFKPRELWPPVLPPDYLATAVKPVGLLLVGIAALTFWMPNTYQNLPRLRSGAGRAG